MQDYATRSVRARVTAAERLETFSLPYRFSKEQPAGERHLPPKRSNS
jgi:hypothetical protein